MTEQQQANAVTIPPPLYDLVRVALGGNRDPAIVRLVQQLDAHAKPAYIPEPSQAPPEAAE